ncbi:CRISPR-associated Csd1 family protein [Methylobacter tundripaludum]|uniref:CRISPR-associated Csd1 family protein n=1 Tax=Methylobacter tundripaludum TaxID=173365 RepID=A0A2S6HAL6_9GAMM|nr:type I-C CRISPR-associated protein Cas8c/Csd1 [Methylobacter tundripaludum]PPK74433.1 CRISPR-associated Csd1 family protein [Methylobacter tundripaludum]
MSWMEKLYQTYEAGVLLDLPQAQLPMPTSHTLQNAHINIVLDGVGNFKRASVLEKTQIVLPATESSASRSSGEAPHPLADKLQYVAKDYQAYGGQKKAYFESYKKQLQSWCESAQAHDKVRAVYRYIEKGTVIQDLLAHNIVFVGPDDKLLSQWNSDAGETPSLFKVLPKEKGLLDQGSALVCWTVEKASDPNADTWKDASIQASWIAYDTSDGSNTGLCFITGNEQTLSIKHPAKIRHSGDKAKLISSNDSGGYTYRGRFIDDAEACGIGFDVSQKAHNALSWLIARQGFRNGDQAYVSWAVSGKPIPEPLQDTWSMLPNSDEYDLNEIDENSEPEQETAQDHSRDLGQSFALQLKNYMAGYAAKLSATEQIIIMGIDSATPGRMGVIYYRELLRDDFLNRLETWHTEFAWPQRHTREIADKPGKKPRTKVIWPVSSPVPMAIAKAAYGENVPDNLKKKVIERLIPCIIDGQTFPRDLLDSCVRKASNRIGYASDMQWLWEKNLGVACGLFKGYHRRHPDLNQRRNYAMALEENYHSRDYLYGRLLATAERIEDVALSVSGENRSTTAARLMQRFADRPYATWRTIELALQPYMQRLRVSRAGFLTNQLKEIDLILALFKHEEFSSKEALSGEFLLGYHCQRQKQRTKTETTDETPSQGDTE